MTFPSGVTQNNTYDASGNILTNTSHAAGQDGNVIDMETIYSYNDFGRISSIIASTYQSRYTYQANGIRRDSIYFHPSTTEYGVHTYYVWDGDRLVHEASYKDYPVDLCSERDAYPAEREETLARISYIYGLNRIARLEGGKINYYLYNAHGDVVQMTDASGAVVRNYDYDAFGVELNPIDNDPNPFRYCGEYGDSGTGNVYLRARYYAPTIGRFLTEDKLHARRTNLFDPYGDYQGTPLNGGLYVDW